LDLGRDPSASISGKSSLVSGAEIADVVQDARLSAYAAIPVSGILALRGLKARCLSCPPLGLPPTLMDAFMLL
jgi:hypothetical protein